MYELIARVNEIVSPAFLVGGSVRDVHMGRAPKDYDFATPMVPDAVEAAVRQSGRRPYLVGKRFGTVGFKLEGRFIEVTTFRVEAYLPHDRKPEVLFTDELTQDLARRDFTMNALAIDPQERVVDPFSGRSDIEARLIRTVGNPIDRFSEDPLRMLRAARFAAQLSFTVEDETLQAMHAAAHTILPISRQRWTAELDKLLTANDPHAGLEILSDTNLLAWILPELTLLRERSPEASGPTYWERTLNRVSANDPEVERRWAALLSDIALPYVSCEFEGAPRCGEAPAEYIDPDALGRLTAGFVERIGHGLRWPTKRISSVADLITGDGSLRRSAIRASYW